MAASLSRDEQLRLIQELTLNAAKATASEEQTSVLALCGLGQEIWQLHLLLPFFEAVERGEIQVVTSTLTPT